MIEKQVMAEWVTHFHTFGFLMCKQLFSAEEMKAISDAFDAAMKSARNEATEPELHQDARGYSAVRQQVNNTIVPYIPFFDYAPDVFYPLLDDERIVSIFRNLMGDDFRVTVTEGLIHAGGSGWHHDNVAREGYFTMRAAIYLDRLGPEEGCLSVIPGSHFTQFREALGTDPDQRSIKSIETLGAPAEEVPGRYDLINEPGDVLFMNHKLFHSALSSKSGRRTIHINATQNIPPEN